MSPGTNGIAHGLFDANIGGMAQAKHSLPLSRRRVTVHTARSGNDIPPKPCPNTKGGTEEIWGRGRMCGYPRKSMLRICLSVTPKVSGILFRSRRISFWK
jgi:hypothetical protein